MRVLLDENIPLALERHLAGAKLEVEHIITLGRRGMGDGEIRAWLRAEDVVFVTQDEEFLDWDELPRGKVLLSRVSQARPLLERVSIWSRAIQTVLSGRWDARLFHLDDSGTLQPWTSG